ncbi:formate C-acetyltransferase [Klebsiella pneumoniae]|uniref:Formate C-acetyltransferase n=1 Tax=Klebsiella pneumoniae TaxID=573 RepID=A0A378B070_KLEPN|nr:formate C-acetyltransferase [Klebsiella pneumoniae]
MQWLYFAYLAAVKSQNGGAMSLGRTATFLDIYIERDLRAGLLNEEQAQELIDHFIMKIRMVRFLRTPEFDSLFSGDPIWATEVLGGMGLDGRTLVSKTTFPLSAYSAYHGPGAGAEPEPCSGRKRCRRRLKNMPPGSLSPPRRCSMRTTI